VNLTYFGKILVVFFDAELLSLKTAIQVRINNFYITILGSMLWLQFSAIFDNFRRKNWRFPQNPMLWSKFCII
jgi:hypothetical protein